MRVEDFIDEQVCRFFIFLITAYIYLYIFVYFSGDCINRIVKYFYRAQTKDGPNNSLTVLLCGETGLVTCLENVFLFGFKSVRLFGRNLYVWDFIGKNYFYR